jgi:putative salt-induced outer membrane protein
MNLRTRLTCAGAAAALGLLGSLPARALTDTDGRWHGSFSAGGSASAGNTRAGSLTMEAAASKSSEVDEITLQGLINDGSEETKGVRTRSAELRRGRARYDFNFSEQLYAFGGAEGEANRPGGVARRTGLNLGAGWRLRDDERLRWDLLGGLGYTKTGYTDGSQRNGPEVLLGEESQHKLGSGSSFKQRAVWYPGVSDVGQRATFDATLSTTITEGWTFNGSLALRWNQKVAPGLKQGDGLLSFGLGYKF